MGDSEKGRRAEEHGGGTGSNAGGERVNQFPWREGGKRSCRKGLGKSAQILGQWGTIARKRGGGGHLTYNPPKRGLSAAQRQSRGGEHPQHIVEDRQGVRNLERSRGNILRGPSYKEIQAPSEGRTGFQGRARQERRRDPEPNDMARGVRRKKIIRQSRG